jgi:hypothetical protein
LQYDRIQCYHSDDMTTPSETPIAPDNVGDEGEPKKPQRKTHQAFRRETAAHTASKFLVSYARKTTRRPPESIEQLEYTKRGEKRRDYGKYRVDVTEEIYWKIKKEAVKRGLRDRDIIDLSLRHARMSIHDIDRNASASAMKCTPNERGKGPGYRAAELCRMGASIDEAARKENVSPASVVRALKNGGQRIG